MSRNLSPRYSRTYSALSKLFLPVLFPAILLFSTFSCNPKGYEFQPESLHWLQFRGPNALGIAPPDADPPIHFKADSNLLWKTEILPGYSSPCVVNDKIFLTGFDQEDLLLCTFAIDRENGKLLWADSLVSDSLPELHPVNSYANPTVASDGNRIFSHFPTYGLIAYETDGNKAWEYRHPPSLYNTYGGCSPVVRDSVIIFNVSIWPNPRLQVQDCRTGDSLWALQDSTHYYTLDVTNATPVFSGNLLIMHQYNVIVAYNMQSREVEWWIPCVSTATSTPVVEEDMVFVNAWMNLGERKLRSFTYSFEVLLEHYDNNGNGGLEIEEIPDSVVLFRRPEGSKEPNTSMRVNEERLFERFDPDRDGTIKSEEWDNYMDRIKKYFAEHGMMALSVNGKGEMPDSMLLWKVVDDTPETPSPLVVGDNVFFIKNGGIITVINRESGEIVKHGRIGAPGSYLASPMLAANRIYTCSYNGIVAVLSAEDFSTLSTNRMKEKIAASPVAIDDVLYVRTDKHLFAFRDGGRD